MLTNIVKATRAHYAALQHRPGPDRVPLHYAVMSNGKTFVNGTGTIQVKAPTDARRKAEMTKLTNRLKAMFPEAQRIEVSFKKEGV